MLLKADTLELVQLAKAFDAAALAVNQSRPTILRALGVQMLSWGFQDFRAKSRGEAGGDGVTWAAIKQSTIVGRIRRLKAYKTKSKAVKRARAKVRAAKVELRKARADLRTSVKGSKAYKAAGQTIVASRKKIKSQSAVIRKARAGGKTPRTKAKVVRSVKAIRGLRLKIKDAKTKRHRMRTAVPKGHEKTIAKHTANLDKAKAARTKYLQPHLANARIGIDTGRLANSLLYGVPGIKMKPVTGNPVKPKDQPIQPAIFTTDHSSVTVGTNMKYAGHFDAVRPIFGPSFLSAARQARLGNLAARAVQIAVRQAAEKKPPQTIRESDIGSDD